MLVIPPDILLLEFFRFLWRWRRVCDLGDQIRRRSFSDAVDKHSEERDLEEEEESDREAVKYTRAVVEPEFLLLWTVADAGEVGVKLGRCQSLALSAIGVVNLAHTSSRISVRLEK